MADEIERKWLVEADDWAADPRAGEPEVVTQGYFGPDVEIRVRRYGDEHTVTWKAGSGRTRTEVELVVDADTFAALWPLTEGRRLEKTRQRVELHDGSVAELDRYGAELSGLEVVEVEFGSEDAAEEFTPPPGFGAEVTGDDRYTNARLAEASEPPESER